MAAISTTLISSITAGASQSPPVVDVLPIESDKAKGCGYYGQNDGMHTVHYMLNAFKGSIIIQGSLEGKPTDDDWFDVTTASIINPTTPLTTNSTKNFTGNFVWVRAVITAFDAGNINRVLFTHN